MKILERNCPEIDFQRSSSVCIQDPPSLATEAAAQVEVSVVIPCLNEANSIAICIDKALAAFHQARLSGEVIVADNGSTDGSIEISERHGARVVHVALCGYGNALRAGIKAVRGKFIIMGDADDSYDFSDIPRFVQKWHEGNELVMGNRLCGEIKNGAMLASSLCRYTSYVRHREPVFRRRNWGCELRNARIHHGSLQSSRASDRLNGICIRVRDQSGQSGSANS